MSADHLQYWVVYSFLNVIESAINAVYWFRVFTFPYAVLFS